MIHLLIAVKFRVLLVTLGRVDFERSWPLLDAHRKHTFLDLRAFGGRILLEVT